MSASARLPVLSCVEAAVAEAAFIAGDVALSWKLMNLAARGVADEAVSLLGRQPKRILVLAGKGNNGADAFLAGYGAAQAVPGPLFTFAAFLGAAMQTAPTGWAGGALALAAVFAPAFLLIVGALPFWESLRTQPRVRAALMGINAAVVGLLLAALWNPVITSGIRGVGDVVLAGVALLALMKWKWPPWVVVAGCAGVGWVMGAVGV